MAVNCGGRRGVDIVGEDLGIEDVIVGDDSLSGSIGPVDE